MITNNTPKHPPIQLLSALAILLAGALAFSQITPMATAAETTQPVYKETTVARGNLTVGVTETGTATLNTQGVSVDFASTVLELPVKAGQTVKKGDVVARVSTDSITDERETLELAVQKAELSLTEAQLNQKIKALTAQQTLTTNQTLSGTAQSTYDSTIEQLEYDSATAANSIDQIEDDMAYYRNLIKGYSTDSDKVTELKQARDSAKEQLDALKAAETPDPEAIAAATTLYNETNSSYLKAKEDYETKLDTAQTKLTNLSNDYDAAILKYRSNQAGLTTSELEAQQKMEQSLITSENAQTVYDLEIAQLQNTVSSAEITLKEAQTKLSDLTSETGVLLAPCDGLVMSTSYKVGEEVPAGASILTIADGDTVYVMASVSQEDIASLSLGSPANVTLSAYETPFTAKVDSIATSPARTASSTVSYNVTALLEGEISGIYEGMTGEITFVLKEVQDVLYLSNKAITTVDGRSTVKMRDANGEIVEVEVEIGFSDGRNVEIISGLEQGAVALIESQVRA